MALTIRQNCCPTSVPLQTPPAPALVVAATQMISCHSSRRTTQVARCLLDLETRRSRSSHLLSVCQPHERSRQMWRGDLMAQFCVDGPVTVCAGAKMFVLQLPPNCWWTVLRERESYLYIRVAVKRSLYNISLYIQCTCAKRYGRCGHESLAAGESWADVQETVSVPALFIYVNLFVACEWVACALLRVLLSCVLAIVCWRSANC